MRFGELLAQALERLEGRVGYDHTGLAEAQRSGRSHAAAPHHDPVPSFPQERHNGFGLLGLPVAQTDAVLLEVAPAAHEVEGGQRVLEGQVLADGVGLDFGGRVAMQVEHHPAALEFRVKHRQLQLLPVVRNRVFRAGVDRFVQPEAFRGYLKGWVLARGSRTVERGGRTMPCTSFCQFDSSGVYFCDYCCSCF